MSCSTRTRGSEASIGFRLPRARVGRDRDLDRLRLGVGFRRERFRLVEQIHLRQRGELLRLRRECLHRRKAQLLFEDRDARVLGGEQGHVHWPLELLLLQSLLPEAEPRALPVEGDVSVSVELRAEDAARGERY